MYSVVILDVPQRSEPLYNGFVEPGERELRDAIVTVRMPHSLRRQVAALAASEDRSVSTQIVRCLRECVQRELEKRPSELMAE
jgi:hypothetical protein